MAAAEDREAHAKVLRLLGEACSMMLSSDKSNEPFEPLVRIGGSRSTMPDDFTDSEIDFFAQIVDSIDKPTLKGRLADLVWLLRQPRNVKFALDAIDSYTQVPLDVDNWFGDGGTVLEARHRSMPHDRTYWRRPSRPNRNVDD